MRSYKTRSNNHKLHKTGFKISTNIREENVDSEPEMAIKPLKYTFKGPVYPDWHLNRRSLLLPVLLL